jgi:uroporphyrinogen decarboxylase
MMNGHQRITHVLKGEETDKVPLMLHAFLPAAREAGMDMKAYRDKPEHIAQAHIRYAEKYKLDGVLVDVDTATLAQAAGCEADFPEDEPARVRQTALKNIKDASNLPKPDISHNQRVQVWLEAARLVKEHFGDELFVRGNCDQAPFSLASMMRGPANWMMDLVDPAKAPYVEALLAYCSEISAQFVELMAATGADMVSNGDSPAGPSMISPIMYRQYALPAEKKMADRAHGHGLPYLLHICGNTDIILEDMAECGADALELDYQTDIYKVKALLEKHQGLTFFGNIDPSGVIARGTPEQVRHKARGLLDLFAGTGRLVIGAGCAIPPAAPEGNIRALVDEVRA